MQKQVGHRPFWNVSVDSSGELKQCEMLTIQISSVAGRNVGCADVVERALACG